MRRVIIIIVLVAVVGGLGVMIFGKPKRPPVTRSSRRRVAKVDSASVEQVGRHVTGRSVGTLKAKTKEERLAEKKRLREAERKRRRELRRQEREKRRMLRYARTRRGTRRTASRMGSYYVVKAVVSLGSDSYALIDSRRVRVGDVVMGRKIVAIQPDRIEVEAFGRRNVVRVGESLLPSTYSIRERRRI
ncbi:MAG: hypothetical protein ABIK47_05095 [candidate division WOR-3 bacterium]